MVNDVGTVVEHTSSNPETEVSNPAAPWLQEKKYLAH